MFRLFSQLTEYKIVLLGPETTSTSLVGSLVTVARGGGGGNVPLALLTGSPVSGWP